MIKVTYQDQPHITFLRVEGHADSAPHGKDLVCAAVSAVVIGGLNALTFPKNYALSIQEGEVVVREIKESCQHDQIVLRTILTGLQTIEKDYPQFIQIQRKD
ncbi:MAG: ribosomal-processing cysteine protease Prp [Bacilli bacterium]|jgi:uncharacterized protein YsxB (DUF464 family)